MRPAAEPSVWDQLGTLLNWLVLALLALALLPLTVIGQLFVRRR